MSDQTSPEFYIKLILHRMVLSLPSHTLTSKHLLGFVPQHQPTLSDLISSLYLRDQIA